MHLGQRPQMPLAHHAGDIAGRFQAIGQGGFGDGQPLVAAARIELVAEAVLVAAGQQARAGRRAVGSGYISVGEPHAGGGQRIQVRRGDILAAVEAYVRIAHVIADNEQELGFFVSAAPPVAGGARLVASPRIPTQTQETRPAKMNPFDVRGVRSIGAREAFMAMISVSGCERELQTENRPTGSW